MLRRRTVVCCDCGEKFTTRAYNKTRCDKCRKKHHNAYCLAMYHRKQEAREVLQKSTPEPPRGEKPLKAETLLNLPCPWLEGRLPESVRLNQLWG